MLRFIANEKNNFFEKFHFLLSFVFLHFNKKRRLGWKREEDTPRMTPAQSPL